MAGTVTPTARTPRSALADETVARVVDAALSCFTHYGLSKTTVEDVAGQAGCSRATLYRYFPGKQALIEGVVAAEIDRCAERLHERLDRVDTLEDVLVEALLHVGVSFETHEALQRVLEVEPEVVLPHVAFDGAERVFARAGELLAPQLARFLPAERTATVGEWVGRVALTYLFCPSEHVSLTDESSVRYLVRTFVLPGIDQTPDPTNEEAVAHGHHQHPAHRP